PLIGLNWKGSLAAPTREIDASPFRNGVAAIVLRRELEKIEAFEKAAAERQRQLQAQEAERQRLKAAEEAAKQAKLKEEADRARIEAERLQKEQQRQPAGDAQPPAENVSPFTMPMMTPPVELKPPPSVRGNSGG
ncbi:AsmA protein, partial [Corallococcus exiguus]|uniref:hypothetical protein n=1 Tax=Corallococcus exiguus TaxID=83462 RepID=UPI0017C5DB8D